MRLNTTGWLILLALIPLFCSVDNASAMSAFSRKYKMQCDGCHTSRIPELNEFGVEFYKNGFALAKKDDGTKGGSTPDGAGAADAAAGKGKAPAKAEPGAPATTGTGEAGEETEAEEPPPKKELPPTVVYRSKSRDGTVFFTDTPERRKDFLWKQDDGEEPTAAPFEVPVQPKKKKVKASRQQARTASVKVEKERYRSYEECMERQLVGVEQPDSGREMMEIMMAAERKCSGYQLEKR